MKRLIESIERHERRLSAVAILLAFIIDSVTLVRVDLYLTNIILITYLVIAALGIFFINLHEDGRARFISEGAYRWIFIAMQFSFAGLFGRFLIYYSRSGSIIASWPFLLILTLLLIGNEFARKHYTRLVLQISFFFLAIFSFLIFFIPVLLGEMSDSIFLLSGGTGLIIISLFIWFISYVTPKRVKHNNSKLFISVGAIFLVVNLLYFTNIIPPIPLSLRESEVYHSVLRTTDGYLVTGEREPAFAFLMPYKVVHLLPSSQLSAYSAVFAPTDFETDIVHDWQYYNDISGEWQSRSRVVLPVVGGQDYGYRGYSIKSNLVSGYWRVNIETLRGQVIGRLNFRVEQVNQMPSLVSETL
jgi:hypothetical protein